MGAEGLKLNTPMPTSSGKGAVNNAVLFIMPSLVITTVSIVLFSVLRNFTMQESCMFAATILLAVILSLVGTAGMQLLVYRIIEEGQPFLGSAINRSMRIGITYSAAFCLVIALLFYPFFKFVLHYPLISFAYFAILLILYSLVWIIAAVFWATERYEYPAVIFSLSYILVFVLSYQAHSVDPSYTISGYTTGIAILLLSSWVTLKVALGRQAVGQVSNLSSVSKLVSQNLTSIFFYIFYTLAIFLDKIIVWVSQGLTTGLGLMITGPYTSGSFLGLIPMFSIATVAYFASKAKPLVKDLYQGALSDIEGRVKAYQQLYWRGLLITLVLAFLLLCLVAVAVHYFIAVPGVMRIALTVSLGSLFFAVIVYNSAALPLFGKTGVAMKAMLFVIIGELAAGFFVTIDEWYVALGFLSGSIIGSVVSQFSVMRLFAAFEYNLFRYVALKAL